MNTFKITMSELERQFITHPPKRIIYDSANNPADRPATYIRHTFDSVIICFAPWIICFKSESGTFSINDPTEIYYTAQLQGYDILCIECKHSECSYVFLLDY